ncbi:Tyrosine recombinase XerC [Methylobacterium bullatum]|uniref:Tyrosine recombinase XerC n=1 Tax=Methylobacterium bullatum TaxID=570505 RepID=A0A679J2P6_9HYPH|nr:Tyrosine recombinase XerC [Methylobacterium bullatum]
MRVPLDVAGRVKGRTVTVEFPASRTDPKAVVSFKLGQFAKVSLRTRDAGTADTRRLAIVAELSRVYAAARCGIVSLSQRQTLAMAGEVYRHLRQTHNENPGTPEEWAAWKAFTRAALEGRIDGVPPIEIVGRSEEYGVAFIIFGEDLTAGVNEWPPTDSTDALEQRCGRLALWVLHRHGIEIDSASHLALLREIAKAALQAGWQLKRQAAGDYTPDPLEGRFPAVASPSTATAISDVFDRWKAEAKPSASTVTTWRGVIGSFTAYLKHDDITWVSDADVIRWKDALVAEGKRPRTINDSHLAALKAVMNYAKRNRIIATNPADGIRVKATKRAGERMLPYEDGEVARLLAIAAREPHPAKRWLPWLAAFTGARIGELAQAWGNQVREIDGIAVLEIRPSPDGGTLKNEGSERVIPLHPILVEAGFVEFARKCGARPMFYGKPARPGSQGQHPSKGTSNHLATWIREQGFTDPRKAPSHASRHWFKSTASRVGIPDSIADALQGHNDDSSASTYRHVAIATLADAVSRIPVPYGSTPIFDQAP